MYNFSNGSDKSEALLQRYLKAVSKKDFKSYAALMKGLRGNLIDDDHLIDPLLSLAITKIEPHDHLNTSEFYEEAKESLIAIVENPSASSVSIKSALAGLVFIAQNLKDHDEAEDVLSMVQGVSKHMGSATLSHEATNALLKVQKSIASHQERHDLHGVHDKGSNKSTEEQVLQKSALV